MEVSLYILHKIIKMRYIFLILLSISTLFRVDLAFAGEIELSSLRYWDEAKRTRLVLDLSDPASYRMFQLAGPDRVVIDLKDTHLTKQSIQQPDLANPTFDKIRFGIQNGHDLRVVFDLKKKVTAKSFRLAANGGYGHRIVLDFYGTTNIVSSEQNRQALQPAPSKAKSILPEPAPRTAANVKKSPPEVVAKSAAAPSLPSRAEPAKITPLRPRKPGKKFVVAIDAGHGGNDPGAMGARGTREKDVVLAIANKLSRLVSNQTGMRSFLVRSGDYFIPLRQRIKLARKVNADIFVSIHADAFRRSYIRGSSVYTLSEGGASSEAARWLAAKENQSDLIGGVSLGDKEDMLVKVLLDLSQTATRNASNDLAKRVLNNLGKLGKIHRSTVQSAEFAVLKSPDVPSILVETAFISNPDEERKLRDPAHQEKVARAILGGIRDYYHMNVAPEIQAGARRHVISAGETLSGIAQKYGTTTRKLQAANTLSGSNIKAGQVLQIPEGG